MWHRHLQEWRLRRKAARARRRTLVRLVGHSTPLPATHEQAAEQLVDLRDALSTTEARTLGERLNTEGGTPLMQAVATRANTLCQLRHETSIQQAINNAWQGIGDWRP